MLLDRLPAELIDMVFGILSEAMLDVVFAAMSCQMLWDLGRRHIYAYLEREVADMWWTGHRVLCCEVDLWISEIPDHILSADEQTELLNTKNSTYPCLIDHLSAEAPHLSFTHTKLSRDLNGSAYYEERPLDIQHAIKLCHPLQSWGSLEQEDIVWPAHPLILRNITRKQYVQGYDMDVALLKKYTDWRSKDGREVENFLDLGHVVLSRICWSSEGPLDDPIDCNETPIHRGIWAGDAFDIISAEDPDWAEMRSSALWEDVTRAATDDLERMFRSVYIERSLEDIED
ncbi:unnamed protein product [Mycena citricolor]|uniref:Uncharacterized protein n=1 Tax=Mycena citricolor TaxID=2018698 RepID=A0AAD2Q3D1_9AGAR|nr:unnamed protein product [Mycena citricolor]CAK5271600.1 unnamed protein product [Mycena citricolor]